MFGLIGLGGFPAMLGIYFSAVPVMMIGLAFGLGALSISLVSGVVCLALLFGPSASSLYLFCDVIPSLLLVFLFLKSRTDTQGEKVWYPLGYALSWLALAGGICALLMVTAISGAMTSSGVVSEPSIEEAVSLLLKKGFETGNIAANQEVQTAFVEMLVPVFMAFVAMLWYIRILIAAFIAQYILTKKQKELRPTPNYLDIYIQNWVLAVLFLAVFIGILASGDIRYLALNFAAVMTLPFCILGICWVHKTVSGFKYATVILIVFYSLLFLVSQFSFLVLGVLGLFEQFSRIYKVYKPGVKEKK